ncbi:MAG: hypothetical protein DHS20C11_30910 [Lysobacteraceae bacterium]|nr:MAG: hypothetical protein DHS20C11_30910 [Xanthomonadaceae bacterium]
MIELNKRVPWALCALIAPSVIWADDSCSEHPPVPAFTASYEVHRNDKKIGSAQVALKYLPTGEAVYSTHTEGTRGMARLLGVDVSESSTARWIDCAYRTMHFEYEQKVAFSNKQHQFSIDWEQNVATGEYKGKPWEIEVQPGYTDSLLVNLQLMTDIAARPELNVEWDYTVIRNNRVKQYRYRSVGHEQVQTPAGSFETLHVARIRDASSERESEVWLDMTRFALPTVIRHVEDGDVLQMKLIAIETAAPAMVSDSASDES